MYLNTEMKFSFRIPNILKSKIGKYSEINKYTLMLKLSKIIFIIKYNEKPSIKSIIAVE